MPPEMVKVWIINGNEGTTVQATANSNASFLAATVLNNVST